MKLIKPDEDRASEYLEICIEYSFENNSRHGGIDTLEKAVQRIRKDISLEYTSTHSQEVKTVTRWLVDKGNTLIGTCRLRTELRNVESNLDGHIGYDIRPSCRKLGYGTVVLKLALEEIRVYGIKNILITCDEDNIGSRKIIEKNGGYYEKTFFDKSEQKNVRRYWINLERINP